MLKSISNAKFELVQNFEDESSFTLTYYKDNEDYYLDPISSSWRCVAKEIKTDTTIPDLIKIEVLAEIIRELV